MQGSMMTTLALLAGTQVVLAAGQADYTFVTVDYAATGNTYLWGMNDIGDVAGGTSALGGLKGLIYDGEQFEVLNFAFWSPAHDISNNREVCGILYPWNDGWGGYRAKDGLMTPTPEHAGAHENHPYGINDDSDIAGWYMQHPNGGFRAYTTDAGIVDPPLVFPGSSTYCRAYGINAQGHVVGDFLQQGGNPVGRGAFVHHPESGAYMYIAPEDGLATGYGINDAGVVVGTMFSPTWGTGSFVLAPPYDLADVRLIEVPGAASTTVRDINNAGEIVGFYTDGAGRYHGFIGHPTPPCAGDATGDRLVDFADLNMVLENWGAPGGPADLDGSGLVDFGDLNEVLGAWSSDCTL